MKGTAAEGRMLRTLPGHSDNIRLTVAFAESYVLVEPRLRDLKSLRLTQKHQLFYFAVMSLRNSEGDCYGNFAD